MQHWTWAGCAVAVATISAACGSSDVQTGAGGTGGASSAAGQGVGEDCSEAKACRVGLECEGGKCALAHSTPAGGNCVVSGECQEGTQCVGGTCSDTTVDGQEGDSCGSDRDCMSGLRCGIVGFGTQCLPEGDGDVGSPCDTAADCFGGLACQGGACGQPPPGAPGFGIPSFPGVSCAKGSANPVRAYFEVPGVTDPAGDEGDFFRLPFPNDARLRGGKPDLEGFPTPGDDLLGYDPVQRYLDAIEAGETGWGTYPTVLFRFSGAIDFDSFRFVAGKPSPVVWVDVTAGTPELGSSAGLRWFASEAGGKYICDFWMGVRRPRGRPLVPGHTYAVYLTTQGTAKDGSAIERSPHLTALLGEAAPSDPVLAEAHTAYKPLRDYLKSESIATSTIMNAAVITASSVRDTMAALAAAVEAEPAPTASRWVKCGGGDASPCPQAEGDRACGDGTADYDEYQALVSLPIFQKGDPPYLDQGGDVDTSGPVRSEDVCMALTVPKGTMPTAGWPLVLYAHGTGGSFRSHVRAEVAGVLSNVNGPGGAVRFAVLGIDQVQHGPRRGDSEESPNNLFFNFANPAAARGNPLQGAVDQIALARFAASLDASATETGGDAIKIDPNAIVFFGHSQGSTHGSLAVPYSNEIKAAVLSGNGASLMDALLTKTEPVNIAAAVPFVLGDFDKDGKLFGGEDHPVLDVLQQWIDPSDPLNFAQIVGRQPAMDETPKSVFQTYGLGDTFSPPVTLATYAIAGDLDLATHDSSAKDPDDIGKKPEQPLPLSGNADVDGSKVTLAVREYGPPADSDGHFVVFDVPGANADAARFLAMAARGDVPQVGQ